MPQTWREPSVIILFWVNMIPMIGVLFFGWGVAIVLALYWLETVMIGVLNIPKMLMCSGGILSGWVGIAGTLFNVAFFTVHFGGFSAGHWMALNQIMGVKNIFLYFTQSPLFWIAVASLIISHLFSFGYNFIRREEYAQRTSNQQMFMPYKRVVVMHLIVLFGGFLLMATNSPGLLLVVLVIIKLIIDAWLHLRSHKPVVTSH